MTRLRHSVVIPAYNAEDFIGSAIASAWESGADEVVVVDDGSSDRTAESAEAMGCLVVRQPNSGAAQARREGVRRATGDVVSLLDADDRLLAEGVARSKALASSSKDWSIVMGGTVGVTAGGERTLYHHWSRRITPQLLIRTGFSPAPPAALLWNRSRLEEALFDHMPAVWPRYAEDYELFIRGSLRGSVIVHDTVAAEYSLDGGKSTTDPRNSIRASEDIRAHYAELLGLRVRRRSERQIASRGLIRIAKNSDAPGTRGRHVRTIVRAAQLDPVFVVGLVVSGVMKRVRNAVK
ncbi:glycosyltransferase [Rathayibacter sp. VKM Ac-2803]|uniref:glycosyltransferase family 2 protein n=1 Tax=Rathayibacter sp. VKM Ac-2803 TaxID=2609256 RepID=UPI00135C21E8|nr:glycosyltransferase family 2 protein [Rathayibacter sp. VKM Ac-2803]MWV50412.1 glycosyltransferase [Rathayibacter sp. VKM Ac-2803]